MRIKDHRLFNDDGTPIPFADSPNKGDALQHKYLVMHFTAGKSAEEAVGWLSSRQAKASAHVVIGRDGSVTQLVPFDRVAWHAGASCWEGLQGMNRYSLGIELDNAGRLSRQGERWRAWFGTSYPGSEVVEAIHKNEQSISGWHDYTPEQMESALQVALLLMAEYSLIDVVGHDDIAPHRKCDPGPAFPMASFRARLLGRKEDQPPLYQPVTALNIRSGPGVQYATLTETPLQPAVRLQLIRSEGEWWRVEVQAGQEFSTPFEGWVNSKYVGRV